MTYKIIESPQNPMIKELALLKQTASRKNYGQILIESLHPVEEAIHSGLEIDHVLVRQDRADAVLKLLPSLAEEPIIVSEAAMARIATTDSAPEVLAIAQHPKILKILPDTTTLGLWNIQDPGNVGTLIRSALAFGIQSIGLLGPSGVDAYHPKVIRSSAGLIFRAQIYQAETLDTTMPVIALDAKSTITMSDFNWPEKALILLGSEGAGLPHALPSTAQTISIPMTTDAESLNVAIAGSIVLSHRYLQK